MKKLTVNDLLSSKPSLEDLKELSFEQGLQLLEELVAKVEAGALPLEKAVLSYEHGVELIAHLRSILGGAEAKLKLLNKVTGESEDLEF